MNETAKRLRDLGQSIWIDNISRETLKSGELRRLVDEFPVTGLTSNPTISSGGLLREGATSLRIRSGTS